MNCLENKKIAVVGVGGVGGYVGAMLAATYPHVTFVARGKRGEAIREGGLLLHGDYHGEMTVHPEKVVSLATELEEQDYLFICVKNYSLEEAVSQLHGAIGENTVIIPVMNGADPGEKVRSMVTKGTVVDALIYIVAFSNPDFSVTQQGNFASLRIGIQHADEAQKQIVQEAEALIKGAGIDVLAAEDIQTEIWRKYILNCGYNVETAYYDNTIGELRDDPEKAKQYEGLVDEAFAVAKAKGVGVTQEHRDAILHRFYHELADDATSSLQRDVCDGRPTELETFCGYLVREAKRLQVQVPLTEQMYEGLQKKTEILTVYGAEICIDCRNLKAILKSRQIKVNYVDITENTANLRSFLFIRDHAPECERVRTMEGGAIGIPLMVSSKGKVTLDVDEAFSWIGQEPVRDEEIVEWRIQCSGCN